MTSRSQFSASDNLINIAQNNPGIDLAQNLEGIQSQSVILVGRNAIFQIPSGALGTGFVTPTPRPFPAIGCVEHLFYGESSDDLDSIRIDGVSYSPSNLKSFREVLLKAALAMKCLNFCINQNDGTMFMLNVYPQCCCECEERKT